MNMEIEKAIDKIAEKFGIVVDWSQDNIYPYIRDILQRYRTVSIVQDAVAIGILGLLILSAILFLKFLKSRGKSIKDSYDEFIFVIFMALYFFVSAILLLITICEIYDLTNWIFVPEMQFVKELAKLK